MYGKVHNNITYQGITSLQIGDEIIDGINNNIVLVGEDQKINITKEENSIKFNLVENYLKEDAIENMVTIDMLQVQLEEGNENLEETIPNGALKIGNNKILIITDLDNYLQINDITKGENEGELKIKENNISLCNLTDYITKTTNFEYPDEGGVTSSKTLENIIKNLYTRVLELERMAKI